MKMHSIDKRTFCNSTLRKQMPISHYWTIKEFFVGFLINLIKILSKKKVWETILLTLSIMVLQSCSLSHHNNSTIFASRKTRKKYVTKSHLKNHFTVYPHCFIYCASRYEIMNHFSYHEDSCLQAGDSVIAEVQWVYGETIQHFEIISNFLQDFQTPDVITAKVVTFCQTANITKKYVVDTRNFII